ncbi:hypothetical protein Hamer_G026434, partial [Homarus americanus]
MGRRTSNLSTSGTSPPFPIILLTSSFRNSFLTSWASRSSSQLYVTSHIRITHQAARSQTVPSHSETVLILDCSLSYHVNSISG